MTILKNNINCEALSLRRDFGNYNFLETGDFFGAIL